MTSVTHFAAAFTVLTTVVFAAAWGSDVSSSLGLGVGLGGVLTGCVYTEQWLRGRDRRRARGTGAQGASQSGSLPVA